MAGQTAGVAVLADALPEYELTGELGRGAMGVVYLGRHRALDRTVAIKELPGAFAADDSVRERFLTEARVVASLDHPHVVVIHDFVDRGGHLAIVMEHLPNGTVWDRFVNDGLAGPGACGLVLATLAGLQHAHERGVMHRDVKPENLIFTHDWQLKVTDFGIAQVLTGRETMGTQEGMIIGTPAYMSPEQAQGRPCGPPADVYASGAMLYEMLSGSLPFPDEPDALAMAMARVERDPASLKTVAPSVPAAIADVTMKALARDESQRFVSAEAFGVALGQAAATTWGPEWMTQTGMTVQGSSAIQAAARTATAGFAPPASVAAAGVDSPPAQRDQQSEAALETRAAANPIVAIQPKKVERVKGADLNELVPADIVNLTKVKRPASPLVPALLGLALLALAAYSVLVGFGSDPEPVGTGLSVNGVAAGAGGEVAEADFTENFALGGLPGESVRASFLGIPLGSASQGGGTFDPDYLRWTAAGVVELSSDAAVGEVASVPVRTANSVYPTALFAGAVVLALGGLASVQSNLRGLRGRRIRIGPYIGLAISGAIAGASLAVLAMLVLATPASLTSVIAAAGAGALGWTLLGEAYRRWRRRRRLANVSVARGRRT